MALSDAAPTASNSRASTIIDAIPWIWAAAVAMVFALVFWDEGWGMVAPAIVAGFAAFGYWAGGFPSEVTNGWAGARCPNVKTAQLTKLSVESAKEREF